MFSKKEDMNENIQRKSSVVREIGPMETELENKVGCGKKTHHTL